MEIAEPQWAASDPIQRVIFGDFLRELKQPWVWLYRSKEGAGLESVGQYSALLPANRVEAASKDPSWEVRIGSGSSGFTQYFDEGEKNAVYERYPGEGIELLACRREFHGVRPAESEVVEEFRLLFNLWEDRRDRTLYWFDESGSPVKAITVDDAGVRALTSLVRRYQAAKQFHLALYIDSTVWSDDLDPQEDVNWEAAVDGEGVFSYYRGDVGFGEPKAFSRLLGKIVIPPLEVEASGIWPFERPDEYEEFLIGLSETGEEIRFTSDPEVLANYFGANPENPHYLTPVYFRREVLSKYYADSDRFSVEDGYLRCSGLWGLRLDNDGTGPIMVFLGDLGRDIPYGEAQYWRSFNIPPPEEGPSETLVRRAFRAEFTNPQSADLRFPYEYRVLNEAWEKSFGWPLFEALHDDDRHVLSKLHIPVSEGAAEFDEQILYLAKLLVLVDSLNETELSQVLASKAKGEKGLAKLQRFLEEGGIENARALLKPFADIQGLRSRGAAHRKSASFDIEAAIGELGRPAGFAKLLEDSIATVEELKSFAESREHH